MRLGNGEKETPRGRKWNLRFAVKNAFERRMWCAHCGPQHVLRLWCAGFGARVAMRNCCPLLGVYTVQVVVYEEFVVRRRICGWFCVDFARKKTAGNRLQDLNRNDYFGSRKAKKNDMQTYIEYWVLAGQHWARPLTCTLFTLHRMFKSLVTHFACGKYGEIRGGLWKESESTLWTVSKTWKYVVECGGSVRIREWIVSETWKYVVECGMWRERENTLWTLPKTAGNVVNCCSTHWYRPTSETPTAPTP